MMQYKNFTAQSAIDHVKSQLTDQQRLMTWDELQQSINATKLIPYAVDDREIEEYLVFCESLKVEWDRLATLDESSIHLKRTLDELCTLYHQFSPNLPEDLQQYSADEALFTMYTRISWLKEYIEHWENVVEMERFKPHRTPTQIKDSPFRQSVSYGFHTIDTAIDYIDQQLSDDEKFMTWDQLHTICDPNMLLPDRMAVDDEAEDNNNKIYLSFCISVTTTRDARLLSITPTAD